MTLKKLIWCTSILMIVGFIGCGVEQGGLSVEGDASSRQAAVIESSQPKVLEILQGDEDSGSLVSLERGSVLLFNDSNRRALREPEVNLIFDFWFEPNDPEITGISDETFGASHVGSDTFLAYVLDIGFDEIDSVPSSVSWSTRLIGIKPGIVFLAKSSSGYIYKVLLQECTQGKMVISYLRLEE